MDDAETDFSGPARRSALGSAIALALVDIYCASYPTPPAAVTLDIDDTVVVVHSMQQLSFWNGHHGERSFLPIHVYDTATGRPVAMICGPARLRLAPKLPAISVGSSGACGAIGPIPASPCEARVTMVGLSPWNGARKTGFDYVFGLPGNAALHLDPAIGTEAAGCAIDRAIRRESQLRRYAAKSLRKD